MAEYALNGIVRDVRVAIDENADVTTLGDAVDTDTLELDDIIRQKAKDAVWWLGGCNGFEAENAIRTEGEGVCVDIPVELYSAYIYHVAYLVYVGRNDDKAGETGRIAERLLTLNSYSKHYQKADELSGANSIGDRVEDFTMEGDGAADELSGANSIGDRVEDFTMEGDGAADELSGANSIGDRVEDFTMEGDGAADESGSRFVIGRDIPQNFGKTRVKVVNL